MVNIELRVKRSEKVEEYKKRYPLLNTEFPPYKAFVKDTLPYEDKDRNIVYAKALTLKRGWSQEFWKDKSKLSKEDRENFQIVVISPRDRKKENPGLEGSFNTPDFTESFYQDLTEKPLGKNPIAKFERGEPYKKTDLEREGKIKDQRKVKSVYIVASLLDGIDIDEIIQAASEYRQNGAIEINLVAPFIKDEREDKNVKKSKGKVKGEYNARIIKIRAVMENLSGAIDRILTYEPHSSTTQAFAAINGIALAPISLEEDLIGEVKNEIINPKDWCWVRPDIGRNLVAIRAEAILDIKGVHLSQLRDSESLEKNTTHGLTDEEKNSLYRKHVLLYDDEAGSFGTLKNVVVEQILQTELSSINIFLGHARLQEGWEENLTEIINKTREKNIPLRVFMTDSRVPIGDLKGFMEQHPNIIKIISVKNKNRKVIKAAVDGIDFWTEKSYEGTDFERAILQFIPGADLLDKEED